MKIEGWIALDIDGTITLDKYSVPKEVITYLKEVSAKGWRLVLATGRAFSFASMALEHFDFPFILLPQNGSVALEMPEKTVLFKNYLSQKALPLVEKALEGFDSDFVIYSGYDKKDICYWRPKKLSCDDEEYFQEIQTREKVKWREVDAFDFLPEFPLVKCFGSPHRMRIVADRLRELSVFEVAQIRDPFHSDYSMLLITDKQASKGSSLKKVLDRLGRGNKVIAAGDDENDHSLLQAADVKIAMSHAPEMLREMADFIAPPTKELGIICALQMVLKNHGDSH